MSPRNDFACAAFVHVNTKPQTVNSMLAWALFSTILCCKPGLETRSYNRLQTSRRPHRCTRGPDPDRSDGAGRSVAAYASAIKRTDNGDGEARTIHRASR